MKIYLKGVGNVELNKRHFVHEGGEGRVYVYKGRGIKIYKDPKSMIPVGKIDELNKIKDSHVITPQNVILDAKTKQPIGYEMRFLKDTISLARVVTKVFRERNGVTPEKILKAVQQMQVGVKSVHATNALVVDGNIMNFQVSEAGYDEIFFIDVDSYQTPHYPATALMRDVRDYTIQNNKFTELSDWFTFGVVTAYFWLGMHPYKGKHPDYKVIQSDGKDKFLVTERRMRDHVSVFNSKVKTPGAAYPLDIIPPGYRDWYEAVLERGKREPPPTDAMRTVPLVHVARIIHSTDALTFEELKGFDATIQSVHGHPLVVVTESLVDWQGRKLQRGGSGPLVVGSTLDGDPVVGSSQRDTLKLVNVAAGTPVEFNSIARGVMNYDDRIYVHGLDSISEVEFSKIGNMTLSAVHRVANILESATEMFSGVAIQNLLGSVFVSVFPKAKEHRQIRMEELDGYRVVDAKFDNNVLMVIGEKKGRFDRLVFRFDEMHAYHQYDVRIEDDIQLSSLNFVTLDSGVCICLNEDEDLEVFSNRKDARSIKVVKDKTLSGDMMLYKDGGRLLVAHDKKLYRLTMK